MMNSVDVNDDKCNRKRKKIGLFLLVCFYSVGLYFAQAFGGQRRKMMIMTETQPKVAHLVEIEPSRLHHSEFPRLAVIAINLSSLKYHDFSNVN